MSNVLTIPSNKQDMSKLLLFFKACDIKIEKQNKNTIVVNADGKVKLLEFESSVSEENFEEIFS